MGSSTGGGDSGGSGDSGNTEGDNSSGNNGASGEGGSTEGDNSSTSSDTERTGFFDSVKKGFEDVIGFFTSIVEWFDKLFSSIGNWFAELWTNIDNGLHTLSSNLVNSITSVTDWLNNREEQKKAEEEEEQARQEDEGVSSINGAVSDLTNRFGFIDNVKSNVNDMVNIITDETKVPKFELNVSSKWYTGKVTVIDFSWYDDYREFGDTVICIFCYLGFLWNIFKRLPDIIQGAGASSYSIDMINDIHTYNKTGFGRSSNLFKR